MQAPQGRILFVHRKLPMGKKRKTLCELCGSVVKYSVLSGLLLKRIALFFQFHNRFH